MRKAYISVKRRLVIAEDYFLGKKNGYCDCWRLDKDLYFASHILSHSGSLSEARRIIEESINVPDFRLVEFKDAPFDMHIAFKAVMSGLQEAVKNNTKPPKRITV